jgi:hypothetical protein
MTSNIDYNKQLTMVSPQLRNIIINNINTIVDYEFDKTGRYSKYWLYKHHPEKEIPLKIYLLGNGNFNELYQKYNFKYGINSISIKEFKNYIRELIKQEILINNI